MCKKAIDKINHTLLIVSPAYLLFVVGTAYAYYEFIA